MVAIFPSRSRELFGSRGNRRCPELRGIADVPAVRVACKSRSWQMNHSAVEAKARQQTKQQESPHERSRGYRIPFRSKSGGGSAKTARYAKGVSDRAQ